MALVPFPSQNRQDEENLPAKGGFSPFGEDERWQLYPKIGAALRLDHGRHGAEVLGEETAEPLGVELLAQSRRPRQVGEQNGDELSLFLPRRRPIETMTACGAESFTDGRFGAARGACLGQNASTSWTEPGTGLGLGST